MALNDEQKKALDKWSREIGEDTYLRQRISRALRLLTPPQQLSDEVLDNYRVTILDDQSYMYP